MVSTTKKKKKVAKKVAKKAAPVVKKKVTTSRKAKPTKKETIIEEITRDQLASGQKITHEEVLGFETLSRDEENAKLTMALMEQSYKALLLESQILQRKIADKKILLESKAGEYNTKSRRFHSFKSEVIKKYNLDPKLPVQFDMDTRMIKFPEKEL